MGLSKKEFDKRQARLESPEEKVYLLDVKEFAKAFNTLTKAS